MNMSKQEAGRTSKSEKSDMPSPPPKMDTCPPPVNQLLVVVFPRLRVLRFAEPSPVLPVAAGPESALRLRLLWVNVGVEDEAGVRGAGVVDVGGWPAGPALFVFAGESDVVMGDCCWPGG
jgi:hypothetical protein